MKKRFENAKVGDLVYCRLYGPGTIDYVDTDWVSIKPSRVRFKIFGVKYTASGRAEGDHIEPTLFYRLGQCNYLTERPANGSKQAFRDCRACLGLDRVAMAAALGVSRHTVRNWETDKHPNCPPDWVWKSIERITL